MNKTKIILMILVLNLGVSGVAMSIDWNKAHSIPANNTKGFFFCIPCII
jgi:hypothetical protein